jgi:hypothetical protein
MISPLLPEHHRQAREHALVFSVEASLNFLSRPYAGHDWGSGVPIWGKHRPK